MLSDENLCKQFGPRSGLTKQNAGPDLDPNCLTLWWYSRKNFSKKLILKKNSRQQKHEKLPRRQRVDWTYVNIQSVFHISFSKLWIHQKTDDITYYNRDITRITVTGMFQHISQEWDNQDSCSFIGLWIIGNFTCFHMICCTYLLNPGLMFRLQIVSQFLG